MRDRIARYTVPGGTVYCCIDARFDGKVASLVVLLRRCSLLLQRSSREPPAPTTRE